MQKFMARLPLYFDVAWGAAVAFCMVGILLQKQAAIVGMFLVAAMWCASMILRQAMIALKVIQTLNDPKGKGEDDDEEE